MENDTYSTWFTPGKIALLGVGGFFFLVFIVCFGFYSYANDVRNEAINKETQLSAQYSSNQVELSNYVDTFFETMSVANVKRDALRQIITDAVRGRYQGDTTAHPSGGQLFSMIKEAYPTVDLGIYDKIVDFIKAGRRSFTNQQKDLLDQLRSYDAWRAQGIVRSWALGNFFPSAHLRACIGKDCVTGQAAEVRMQDVITDSQTQKAYDTGTMQPLIAPKN